MKRYWNPKDELDFLRRMEKRTNASDLVHARKTLSGQVAAHGRGLSLTLKNRAGNKAPEIGAFLQQPRELVQFIRHGIERIALPGEIEKRGRIAPGYS